MASPCPFIPVPPRAVFRAVLSAVFRLCRASLTWRELTRFLRTNDPQEKALRLAVSGCGRRRMVLSPADLAGITGLGTGLHCGVRAVLFPRWRR